jgi:hypothetical protein
MQTKLLLIAFRNH